jgi:hypothetical protein
VETTCTSGPVTEVQGDFAAQRIHFHVAVLHIGESDGPFIVFTCTWALLMSRTSTVADAPSRVTSPCNFSACSEPVLECSVMLASAGTRIS